MAAMHMILCTGINNEYVCEKQTDIIKQNIKHNIVERQNPDVRDPESTKIQTR